MPMTDEISFSPGSDALGAEVGGVDLSSPLAAAQIDALKAGRSHAQIGQRPFEMGHRAPDVLVQLIKGETVEDPLYTGLDECTAENSGNCPCGPLARPNRAPEAPGIPPKEARGACPRASVRQRLCNRRPARRRAAAQPPEKGTVAATGGARPASAYEGRAFRTDCALHACSP